ncbi:hypothetical protein PIB30_106902, partial [Stylosanthes scabra]|nr:hypothetical protein [Stylosanthes scabra]
KIEPFSSSRHEEPLALEVRSQNLQPPPFVLASLILIVSLPSPSKLTINTENTIAKFTNGPLLHLPPPRSHHRLHNKKLDARNPFGVSELHRQVHQIVSSNTTVSGYRSHED